MDGNAAFQRALRVLLWIDGEPDPRVLQAGFTALVLLDRVLRRAGGMPLGPGNWPLRGGALAILLLLVVILLPRPWRTPSLISIFAVADIAVVGVSSLSPEDGGAGLLVVLPALWLGSQHRIRGVLVGVGATFVLVTIPGLAMHSLEGEALSRLVPLPLVAGFGALAVSASLDAARSALQRAEEGERRLRGALAVLEAERQTSQEVFEAVDVGLMLLDRDGTIIGINRKYDEYRKLSVPDEATPWPGDTYAADGRTLLRADQLPSARAARGEEFDDYRIWAGADPWTRRAVSVSARQARDETGEVVGSALACSDITDLMRALDVKDEFVATVSHELRTPLTSIAGYVSILLEEEEDLPAWIESKLRVVDRNTKRLTALVEALLQQARHTDGPLPLAPVEIDLARVVASRALAAAPAALAAGVVLEYSVPGEAVVVADPERISQVVDNLVSNAIKHTRPGGHVEATLDHRGDGVEISVTDTGIGIPLVELDRLFTRFYRTRAATEAAIQGVGLGLSTTKAIVESHGGRIDVSSEVGQGTVFRVWLPTVATSTSAA